MSSGIKEGKIMSNNADNNNANNNNNNSSDTFVVLLMLARGAVRGAAHLHIAVNVGIRRNFGVNAHFLSVF